MIEETFGTTIQLEETDPIPAARWKVAKTADPELAGFLAAYDVSFRVRRAVIPAGLQIQLKRTHVTEDGVTYRVDAISDAKGDPAIILGCKQV